MRKRLSRKYLEAVAKHEATHCVVARYLGLDVVFVACQPHKVVAASKLEAFLYQGKVAEGEALPALVTRLHPGSWLQDPQAVLAAMVAPSYIRSGSAVIDAYARWERRTAIRFAYEQNEPPHFIEMGRDTARGNRREIKDLQKIILERGRVWF